MRNRHANMSTICINIRCRNCPETVRFPLLQVHLTVKVCSTLKPLFTATKLVKSYDSHTVKWLLRRSFLGISVNGGFSVLIEQFCFPATSLNHPVNLIQLISTSAFSTEAKQAYRFPLGTACLELLIARRSFRMPTAMSDWSEKWIAHSRRCEWFRFCCGKRHPYRR